MKLGPTFSLYDDPALKELKIDGEVGHQDLPDKGISGLEADDRYHFIKTHGLPRGDDFPTIYIVRDGRNAIVSYAHYLKEIDKKTEAVESLIAKLITGQAGGFGLWSDHFRKWRKKPGKMVTINYEELAQNPVVVVCKALRKIGFPESLIEENIEVPSFSDLKNKSPKFFRSGIHGSWTSDMTDSLERQFWKRHRMGMALAGYEAPEQRLPHASEGLPEIPIDELVENYKRYKPILDEICMPPYYGPERNEDFDFLINFAVLKNVKEIFEYGTASGNTVANLCKYTDAHVTTLNSIPDETSGKYRTYDLEKSEIGSVYRKYGFEDRVTQVYSDSLEFVPETVSDSRYDLVIIDACHDFEYVISDFLAIYQLVEPSGYVLFHDCDASMAGHLEGVWRACTHLRKAGFNIRKVKGTWWGIWSPSTQTESIDLPYLSILEYEIENRRDRNRETIARNNETNNLRKILEDIQAVFGVRAILWLRKKINKFVIKK